jgi:hypothetical protein
VKHLHLIAALFFKNAVTLEAKRTLAPVSKWAPAAALGQNALLPVSWVKLQKTSQ